MLVFKGRTDCLVRFSRGLFYGQGNGIGDDALRRNPGMELHLLYRRPCTNEILTQI
jgi:hypothetical protein